MLVRSQKITPYKIRKEIFSLIEQYLIPHKIQVSITTKGHCDEVNRLECLESNKQNISEVMEHVQESFKTF
jgi:hypothetical protein